MPIYDFLCPSCNKVSEILVTSGDESPSCPECGHKGLNKLMSATSSMTGKNGPSMPGPGDTACCGSSPGQAAGCAGPGSCCGRNLN